MSAQSCAAKRETQLPSATQEHFNILPKPLLPLCASVVKPDSPTEGNGREPGPEKPCKGPFIFSKEEGKTGYRAWAGCRLNAEWQDGSERWEGGASGPGPGVTAA